MTDVLDRLDDALLEATQPQESHAEGWRIRTDDEAAWVSRKAQDAHRNLARIDAWAEREKARIDAVAASERRPYVREVEWATGHLHVWLRGLLDDGREKKSIALPGGTFAIRARPPKLEIEDEDTAITWLSANAPELVRTRMSVDKSALKKALQTDGNLVALDGQPVEWVRFEPQEESATFKPEDDEGSGA